MKRVCLPLCGVVCVTLLMSGAARAEPSALHYAVPVTQEVGKAFTPGDAVEIFSVTGTTNTFQVGGTYRVVGLCRLHAAKNAMLYLGNTTTGRAEAIRPADDSSLSKPLTALATQFDITFTVLQPGQLHVSLYDMDNHDPHDNSIGGIILGQVAAQ